MAAPEFTEPFNVEGGLWESYKRFIERLRNLLAVRFAQNHDVRFSHNHAVTPVEVNPPIHFFDIEFRTNNTQNITVRFRGDNLYLVGYQTQNPNQWWELRHDNFPQHRIAGSNFLDFGESYDNLTVAAGVVDVTGINVGRQELIDAINELANPNNNNRVRAQSLLVLLLMISESLRFNEITNHFTTHRTTQATPTWIDNYRRGWRTLSFSLLHVDADAHFRFPPNNRFQVYTVEAALAIIGVMKGHLFGPGPGPGPGPAGQGRRRRMADIDGEYYKGRPLVEVFSVTINNIQGNQNTRGNIYGTIQVSDGLGYNLYIYNREPNGSESIHTNETTLLNGPARCITAYDDVIINVALKSKEGLSEDNEVSKGEISWDVMNITTNEYDKLLRRQVKGQNGSAATVSYAVLSDAVQATIEVTLIDSLGGKASIDVYGQLAAHNSGFNNIESVLFRKADNKYINVKCGKVIPLSRSVVAVPLNSNLIVEAHLKESINLSPDNEIANGKATFSPHLSGTYENNISSVSPARYRIKVKVTWDWYV